MTSTENAAKHRLVETIQRLANHLDIAADDSGSAEWRAMHIDLARRELRKCRMPNRGIGGAPESWGPAELLDAIEEELLAGLSI